MLTFILLATLGQQPQYDLWEARLGTAEKQIIDHDGRIKALEAHVESIHDDISGIYELLKPTALTPAPNSSESPNSSKCAACLANGNCEGCTCEACQCAPKASGPVATASGPVRSITLLTAPFACPACERLKVRLKANGLRFTERVDRSRSSWPVLLVDGTEVDPNSVVGAPLAGMGETSRVVEAKPVGRATFATEPRRTRVGPLRGVGRLLFGGGKGLRSPLGSFRSGGSCGVNGCGSPGGGSCGNPGCHVGDPDGCSCR